MSKRLFLALVLCAVSVGIVQLNTDAQPAYAVASFSPGAELHSFTAAGVPLPPLVLPGGGSPDSICMGPANRAFLIGDTTGVHRVPIVPPGPPVFIALPGGSISWLDVDEDGELVWCTSTGDIWEGPLGGPYNMIRADAGFGWNTICWNGSTGNYVAGRFGGTPTGLHAICRDGTCLYTYGSTAIASISGCDWDPHNGEIAVSSFGSALTPNIRTVDVWGNVVLRGPGSVVTQTNNSVEVVENPQTSGSPSQPGARYLGSEFGSAPQHLYNKRRDGVSAPFLIASAAGVFGPADAEIYFSRQVWGLSPAVANGVLPMSCNFGPLHANEVYVMAASLSHTPGINFGAPGWLHLNFDPVFFLSAASVAPPFANFAGVLNGVGAAVPPPVISLPGSPGLRFYVGAITISRNQITEISNCFGVTIQ